MPLLYNRKVSLDVDRMASQCAPGKKTLTQSQKSNAFINLNRISDTCSPDKNKTLQSYRIYTILIPIVLGVFILEAIFIIIFIPESLGSVKSIKGSAPDILSLMKSTM